MLDVLLGSLIALSSAACSYSPPICETFLHERITVRWAPAGVKLTAPQLRALLSKRDSMHSNWPEIQLCHALESGQGDPSLNRRRLAVLASYLGKHGLPEGEDAEEVSRPFPQPDKGEGRVHIYACQFDQRYQNCRQLP